MINRKTERFLWITLLVTILVIFTLTVQRTCRVRAEGDIYGNLRIFNTVLNYIRNEYVEKKDPETLIFGAIDGMLATLNDPYTKFLRKKDFNEMQVETSGKFGGLGIYITIQSDKLIIEAPISGTPASRAGLKPYDEILTIDGQSTKGITIEDAVSKLRGKVGTKVVLTIQREGFKEPLEFTLIRDEIKIKSVVADVIKDKNYAYIRIKQFGEETTADLEKILSEYENKNIKGIILDVRSNPGGLLITAWKVADLFFDDGMIVYTKGRLPEHEQEFKATMGSYCKNKQIVVLIDKGTASAAEIVTGALKDRKRAIIIGQKSFGKGVVQTVKPIGDGMALSFTTAKYYTPSGVCIHQTGIEPDIKVDVPEPTEDEIRNAKKLWESGKVQDFVKKHPSFSDDDINNFKKELENNGIFLSQKIIRRIVMAESYRNDEIIYDLYDDPVLIKAIETLDNINRK